MHTDFFQLSGSIDSPILMALSHVSSNLQLLLYWVA